MAQTQRTSVQSFPKRFEFRHYGFGLHRSITLRCFSLVIISFVVVGCEEQDSFFFDPSPVDQDVVEGGETRLRCDVSSRRMIVFYWTLNGRQLQSNGRRFQEDGDLRFSRVDRLLDAGSFRCVATNTSTGMALRSTEAKLNILWIADQAEVQLKSSRDGGGEVAEGSEVVLKCHADGNPEPVVEWFRNKIKISSSERIRFLRNRLRIQSSSSAVDNGVYSCRARNSAGSVQSVADFLLNIPGTDAARLNAETFTSRLVARRGSRVQLHCEFSNALSTEWQFSDSKINDSKKYSVLTNGTLVVSDVQETDAGTYRCVASSRKGPTQTFAAELLMAYLDELTVDSFEPRPSSSSLPTVIPVNSKFEVVCRLPAGLPQPTLRWIGPGLKQSTVLDRSSRSVAAGDVNRIRVFSTEDGLLSISNAEETDGGNYSCIVQNLAGITNKSIWIVVSVPPVLIHPPMSIRVTEDDSASFECKVAGTPFPVTRVSWTFDGNPIEPSNRHFEMDVVTGTLRLSCVSLTDEGNYACTVNTTGHPIMTSNNAHLYVEKKLKFQPLPVNSKLELGSHSQIVCRADGRSLPKVKWFKEGATSLPDQVDDLDGLLVFLDVRHSDAGRYTCVASSDQGLINVTITVDVIVKPKFKVRPLNTTTVEGQPAMLHCVATGEPLPTIQWDRSNKVNSFDFQRFKVLNNGSLSISEVYMEDSGKYGCTAGNSGGFEHAEVYLQVIDSDSHQRLRFSGADGAVAADNFDMMKTIVIATCSAVAYLAIVIGITVYCSIRLIRAKSLRKHDNAANSHGENVIENGLMVSENTELVDKKSKDTIHKDVDVRPSSLNRDSLRSSSAAFAPGRSFTMQRIFDKFSFPRKRLVTLGLLGKGRYGDVFLAKVFGIQSDQQQSESLVVVKSLLSRTSIHVEECLREIHLFSCVNHEHVTQLFGICREAEPICLVMEYCEWGDLKKLLLATSSGSSSLQLPSLTLAQRTSMCGQVSLGMEHIANIGLVHRDLAARNVVVSPTLDVKVTSLGLSRDAYAGEYFLLDQHPIPLRWMSPEAILDGEYSAESDVWSFGVMVWEVFSCGELPLANRTNEQVLEGLNSKENRLLCPPGCPKDIWSLVQTCMGDCTHDRPSFSDVITLIYDILSDGVHSS